MIDLSRPPQVFGILLVCGNFFRITHVLGVAIYHRDGLRGTRFLPTDDMLRYANMYPSHARNMFPSTVSMLNRRLSSTGNAMSSVRIEHPMWCNPNTPISEHLDSLYRICCLEQKD